MTPAERHRRTMMWIWGFTSVVALLNLVLAIVRIIQIARIKELLSK